MGEDGRRDRSGAPPTPALPPQGEGIASPSPSRGEGREGGPAQTQDVASSSDILSAPYVLEYTYTRSTGPVIGRFLTALRDGRIEGARTASGRVIVPALEHDPATGEPTDGFVAVADRGEVTSWAWVAEPRPTHPLNEPFAFALIRLDGADTALAHAVRAPREAMATGMRVRARWADERSGAITDIAWFIPEEEGAS